MQKLFSSAWSLREHNRDLYGADGHYIEPWTSDALMLQTSLTLFDETSRLLSNVGDSDRAHGLPEPETRPDSRFPKLEQQLRDLASVVLRTHRERLDWLETYEFFARNIITDKHSSAARDGNESDRERAQLQEQYALMRPQVLRTLVKHNCTDFALALAEQYHDFRTLTELSHDPRFSTTPDGQSRTQHYIDRFRDDFAFDLFSWYIERGAAKSLFDQADTNGAYIDAFFASSQNPRLAWLQHVLSARYAEAADVLLKESTAEPILAAKHVSGILSTD